MPAARRLSLLVFLFLALCGASLAGQEAPALPALPELPTAPYVREHEEALKAHAAAALAELKAARERKSEADARAAEPGITEEERTARRETAERAAQAVSSLEARVLTLENAAKAARAGPSAAQLAARQEYDRLVKRGEDALAELIGEPRADRSEREGALARAIREAEEELGRVSRLSAEAREFDGPKSRLYERLNDLEKLDYELRWAEQRLKLSLDEYDHLVEQVFSAYVSYESRGLEALQALREAREVQYPLFADSPAASLLLPLAARSLAEVNTLQGEIEQRVDRRRGRQPADRLKFTLLIGRLREVQQEIDLREDYKERLDAEVETLKDRGVAAPRDKDNAGSEKSNRGKALAEYQELSERIDDFLAEGSGIQDELKRLREERLALVRLWEEKQRVEARVAAIVGETQGKIAALEAAFAPPAEADPGQVRSAERNKALYFPWLRLAALHEELEAQQEREGAARRDTRYAQTRVEVLDRRMRRLEDRGAEIGRLLLPQAREAYRESLLRTAGDRALRVIAVVLAAWFLTWLIRAGSRPLIERYVRRASTEVDAKVSDAQRGRTLVTVMTATTRLVIFVAAVMAIMAQFDVDYGPLLVAAGGVSLAVGFGAQSLIKDFFAGFFILLEGQYSIGDVVEINGKTGTIESLNLRTTVIRSLNGDVHTIPNGQISLTTNQTKLWSRTIVDINVAHEENVEDIMAVLDAVARAMQQDEVWGRKILDSVVMGVQGLGENAVVIRVLLKTRAGEQWGAAREYHKRVKLKFDELGIEIPRPQRVVSHRATDEKVSAAAMRKKRAAVLRFVRASRGEALPDELELAAMSVEERDRAATLAKLTTDKPAGSGQDAKAQAAGPPDAERLAERMAQDAAAVPRPESPPPAPDVQPKAAPGDGPRPAS